jgi:hypothetical protein
MDEHCLLLTTRYRWREEVYLYEPLGYELRRAKLAVAIYQGRTELEVRPKARDNKPCSKHTWVYYHSAGTRECIDCPAVEKLWADFGLIKKDKAP